MAARKSPRCYTPLKALLLYWRSNVRRSSNVCQPASSSGPCNSCHRPSHVLNSNRVIRSFMTLPTIEDGTRRAARHSEHSRHQFLLENQQNLVPEGTLGCHSGGINARIAKSKRPFGFEVSPHGCFQQQAAFRKRRYCVSAAASSTYCRHARTHTRDASVRIHLRAPGSKITGPFAPGCSPWKKNWTLLATQF